MNAHSKLIEELVTLEQELFTGTVIISNPENQQWRVYLYRGKLAWIEGGYHSHRFWQRHLSIICSQADIQLFDREKIASNSDTDYYFINTLLNQKLAARERVKNLIQIWSENIFFDIFQSANKQGIAIESQSQSAHSVLKNNFNLTLINFTIYQVLSKIYERWSIWEGKGLSSCSPNLAPVLKKETNIDRQVSSLIFKNMKRMLDGKQTLRDLATQTEKDIFDLTCALIPYFFKGYIRLIEIPDLPRVNLPSQEEAS